MIVDSSRQVSLDKELKSSGFNAEQHAEFNEEIMAAVMARTSMRNGHQSINQCTAALAYLADACD